MTTNYENNSDFEYELTDNESEFCKKTENGYKFINGYEEKFFEVKNQDLYNILYKDTKLPEDIIGEIVDFSRCNTENCNNIAQKDFFNFEIPQGEIEYYKNLLPIEDEIDPSGCFCDDCEKYIDQSIIFYEIQIQMENDQYLHDIYENDFNDEEAWDGNTDI